MLKSTAKSQNSVFYIAIYSFLGVGKTSLVNLICHNESLPSPAWTIGCFVETKVFQQLKSSPRFGSFFLSSLNGTIQETFEQ